MTEKKPENKEKKSNDILDDVKKEESRIKRVLFLQQFNRMKELAHRRLRLQEELRTTCEQLGLSKTDTKRVIDFINEGDDVKLTERDIGEIESLVRDKLAGRKKELFEEIEEQPIGQRLVMGGPDAVGFQVPTEDIGWKHGEGIPPVTAGDTTSYITVSSNDCDNTVSLNNGKDTLNVGL